MLSLQTGKQSICPRLDPVTVKETLSQGDALYIPRSWAHRAQTSGNTSIHITVGSLVSTSIRALETVWKHFETTPLKDTSPPLFPQYRRWQRIPSDPEGNQSLEGLLGLPQWLL
jgi:ribosomal protein L16 Arg81 hydroxylase